MSKRFVFPVLAALAALPGAAHAQAPSRTEDDEIVVSVERPRGSVPGDIPPESTLSGADVRAYGATSIFQILGALAPQTGSASIRGGGQPIVLVNGRRISGLQEIRDLPPDVISRVDVFDEQLSLQYGYSAEQRVVNLVLEKTYDAQSIEASGGVADGDARANTRFDVRTTQIDEGNRFAAGLTREDESAVSELERGIAPPTSGPDARYARTLAPETGEWRANATLSRALSERVTGNASLRVEQENQRDLLGLDGAFAPRPRTTETHNVRAVAGLDGAQDGWQWTTTATADVTRQNSLTVDSLAPSRSESEQRLYDVTANANGATIDLPSGVVRASLRLGVEHREIDSFSADRFGRRGVDLERTTPSGRATLSAPITSRRREFGEAFGDISVNATASFADPSDVAALNSLGYGASWSPVRPLRFTLQAENSEAAATLQQLGDPLFVTPDVTFFDSVLGQSVRVTRTTGGNPALVSEEREDLTFNASFSPPQVQGLSLQASWARNDSTNVAVALPTALTETQLAFPGRFQRDGSGTLVAVDSRPINLAERNIESVRVGFSYSRSIGGQRPPGGQARGAETAPRRGPPTDAAPGQAADGPPSPAEQRAGLGGGGRAGGRWNVSVFYRTRLMDDAVLAQGQAPIDLLDRGGLEGRGDTASAIEFEGGLFSRGLGLRFSGGWTDGFELPVATGGALDFSDRWTLNARLFVNVDARPGLLRAAPLLKGGRIGLSIDNLTDSFVEVRDATGATPTAYQEGYQNPLGRVVQVSFRKQF